MNNDSRLHTPIIFTAIAVFTFIAVGLFGLYLFRLDSQVFHKTNSFAFNQFDSEEKLRDYIQNNSAVSFYNPLARSFDSNVNTAELGMAPEPGLTIADKTSRVSSTNVQVSGIDEPDIVKTNGEKIFLSTENYLIYPLAEPVVLRNDLDQIDEKIVPPIMPKLTTKIINAKPVQNMQIDSEVDLAGNLLAYGNTLMIITDNKVSAHNVSDAKNPGPIWNYETEENFRINDARLLDGKLYLVISRYADYRLPCPTPVLKGESMLSVPCTDIFVPGPAQIDTLYSIARIKVEDGSIEDTVNFVGSSSQSIIYMSHDNIYLTFTSYPNPLEFIANFFSQNPDLLNQETLGKIKNLNSYDISKESKLNELNILIQMYLNGLSNEERLKRESEITTRINNHLSTNGRELERTSIIKINKNSLDPVASGEVAGAPLNQFSLDEYNGNLRIATTINPNTMFGSAESVNDLYVLDNQLNLTGSVKDLGRGERIYSARFINNLCYLVTFKQIDPFFIIDLTDSAEPKVSGELKIPGFSSYLHPVTNNIILGVGQEDGRSKLSLFNVSDQTNPVEIGKYMLNEYYSEVEHNHRAFLNDEDNKYFFIPAGQNGYIFSYDDGLTLKKVIPEINARRALYIDDVIYILGETKITALSVSSFEEISSIELNVRQ